MEIFEVIMLVCFGLSWPANIAKSIRSGTAKGKSLTFELFVITGYTMGLLGKLLGGNINPVLIVYIMDWLMVATDIVLTIHNMSLDKKREAVA